MVHDLQVDLDRTPILREVSCAAGSGSWLALLGPNGSGKTTLLRAIAGLIPYRGTVTLDGPAADAGSLRPRERARLIAYVPQTPTLPPDMTVTEYVLLGRTPHLSYLAGPGRADRDAAARAAGLLDVTRFAERRLVTLSGGERQRVVLARALAQEPKILLLDEPTSALDIGHQQNVLDLVDALRRSTGLTVITTLHDLTTAGQYAHELVLLNQGRVEAAGVATAVLTEDRIAKVYAARVTVSTDAAGNTVVTPVRAHPPLTDPLSGLPGQRDRRQQDHPGCRLVRWWHPAGVVEGASVDGGMHGAGDPGPPQRPRPGEILARPAGGGGDADGVRRGPGAGESRLQDGLGLGLGRGDNGVDERRVAERNRDRDDDVDRPWPPDRRQLRIGRPVRRGGPGRHAQAHRGRDMRSLVFALDDRGDLGGGQQPDPGTGKAEAGGQIREVRHGVDAVVAAGYLGVEHPFAWPETAADDAAGDHLVARAGTPQCHRQPAPVLVTPVQLQPHAALLACPGGF